jgi:hypothetical protein
MKCKQGYKEKEGKCMKSKGIFDRPVFRRNKWMKPLIITISIIALISLAVFLAWKFGGLNQAFSVSSPSDVTTGFGGGGGHS